MQTEGTYVSRQAQGSELSREGSGEYELDALDDARTCAVCRGIEHRAFRFGDMAVGQNYPPLHPRCRCAVNPHVADWDAWVRGQADERRAEAAARRFGAGEEKSVVFRTPRDPAVEYFGPAERTNPDELETLRARLEKAGVKVVAAKGGTEGIGYSSGSDGMPGQLHYTPGMSWAAWLHENDHFERDRENGFPGFAFYMKNNRERADMERSAYGIEIEMARRAGYDELVRRLEELRGSEVGHIEGMVVE